METTTLDGVTLTAEAAAQILLLVEDQATRGLRIFVEDGGCSGRQYGMSIDASKDDDMVFELQGAKVFIDPASLGFLRGSIIDYEGGLTAAGFRIRNPNAKHSCGCGTSFET